MTGGLAEYSWCPTIVLTSVIIIFLLDFGAERYFEIRYGVNAKLDIQGAVTGGEDGKESNRPRSRSQANIPRVMINYEKGFSEEVEEQQIAAFLILEFGVIFYSVIIGPNFGVVGSEFSTLYAVLVFHQSFKGLGIGARMSAIPFKPRSWFPWMLYSASGLTTPIAIAIGLGLRTTYDPNSFTAISVGGVLDAMSAGTLIYTGLIKLLARDFLFNPLRTRDCKRLASMKGATFLGWGLWHY